MIPRAPTSASLLGALLVVQVAFGSLSVAGKVVFREMTPTAVALVRVAAGAAVLLAIERALASPSRARPGIRDHAAFLGFAILGVVLNQVLFLNGLARTTAVNATLLVTTIPAFTMLAAWLIRGDRPGARGVAGVALAMSGVALLVGLDAITLGGRHLAGNLMVTANSASYAVYLVVSRGAIARFGPLTVIARSFLLGAVVMGVLGARDLLATDAASLGGATWGALAWIVLVSTVVAYGLTNWALARLDPGTVSAFIPLQPVVAALLAVPFLGERLAVRTVLAGLVVIAGVVLAGGAARPRPVPA